MSLSQQTETVYEQMWSNLY